ncbi:MAG: hypothetical protein MJ168_07500 [Clostridia bacterium]|nr:hypothetical protein [Clostridia bacterium]
MHSFKKVFISSITFLLIISVLTSLLIIPHACFETAPYSDRQFRKELAGSIDTIFLGASHGLKGFVVEEIDTILGTKSYNLSGDSITWHAREALIKEEIDRNPLKTVYIDIAFDTFKRDNRNETEGNSDIILRLNSFKKNLKYLFSEIDVEHMDDMYAMLMRKGFKFYIDWASGKNIHNFERKNMGYDPYNSLDISLNNASIIEGYKCAKINPTVNEENLQSLDRIVKMCQQRNIEVVFVAVPISECEIWCHSGWNVFENQLKNLGEKYNCKYYDFSLFKCRYDLLFDAESFHDNVHLCDSGAREFSKAFADCMLRVENGEDISNCFYSSYDEAIKDSQYMKYYSEHK